MNVAIDPHPRLDCAVFETTLPRPQAELSTPESVRAWLRGEGMPAPMHSTDEIRTAIRDLLRQPNFKPTGRSKPASEYLQRAISARTLGLIWPAVDCLNAVSYWSGLPISIVDLDLARPPFRIGLGAEGDRYAFNSGGQEIDVHDLLCLFDADGPCANPVKDAQRTKTSGTTIRTLTVVWGTVKLPGRTARAATWLGELLGAF